MQKWDIIMWEPSISPHKMDFYLALKRSPEVGSVTYVAQSDLSDARKALGWTSGRSDEADCIVGPSADEVEAIVENASPSTVHLFSGIRHVPCIVTALNRVLALRRRFGLMSEPRALEGASGLARLAQSWATEGQLRRNVDFVLAIGRHGPGWFKVAGYAGSRIYPFAYFLPDAAYAKERPVAAGSRVRVTYLGRTVREKGIEVFLESLAHVRAPISVTVAGTGKDAPMVEAFAARHAGDFSYRGAIPMHEVPGLLQNTDILVQPSLTLDDGWGAVVSEALFAGAYVITSDRVGASICLDDTLRGAVIPHVSGKKVASAIDEAIAAGRLSSEAASRRSTWARGHLTGAVGAKFLLSLFRHLYGGQTGRPMPFYAD